MPARKELKPIDLRSRHAGRISTALWNYHGFLGSPQIVQIAATRPSLTTREQLYPGNITSSSSTQRRVSPGRFPLRVSEPGGLVQINRESGRATTDTTVATFFAVMSCVIQWAISQPVMTVTKYVLHSINEP